VTVNANHDLGRTLVRAGYVALVMAGVAPLVALVNGQQLEVAGIALRVAAGAAAAILFGVMGALLVSYGRRLQVPPGAPLVADASRPSVLYLRSFSADRNTMPGTEAAHALMATAEETLRDRLASVGEMVAIGRPGEPLPPIGVPRIYRDDDQWQATVLDLMRVSRLTVLAYGSSSGLVWEIGRALEHVPAERLLLWFPTRALWHAFAQFARTDPVWTRGLPATAADVHLLAFHPDGTPRVLEVHGTTVVHDFSSEFLPDTTEEGDVSPGGLEGYLDELGARLDVTRRGRVPGHTSASSGTD
jgi:hypothetical protein